MQEREITEEKNVKSRNEVDDDCDNVCEGVYLDMYIKRKVVLK